MYYIKSSYLHVLSLLSGTQVVIDCMHSYFELHMECMQKMNIYLFIYLLTKLFLELIIKYFSLFYWILATYI